MEVDRLWSGFDLAEGFHLAHAVVALHNEGILHLLKRKRSAKKLAQELKLNITILRGLLQYVAARTEILEQEGDKFWITNSYSQETRFYFDQYVGAYAPNARALTVLLRDSTKAGDLVDRQRHAEAFVNIVSPSLIVLRDLVLQLELGCLLDLGCGPGSLLIALAEGDPDFCGWGVDVNPVMCSLARDRIRSAGLERRLSIFEGDCRDLANSIPKNVFSKVKTVLAASLVNEFFISDEIFTINWLRQLSAIFPGLPLLLSDYYGQLGCCDLPSSRQTALHDFAQIISGQGVPPKNRLAWGKIYSKAGCTLVFEVEDNNKSFFINILRLNGSPKLPIGKPK